MNTRRTKNKEEISYKPSAKYSLTKGAIDDYYILHSQCQEINGKYYIISMNPYTNELLKASLPIITDVKKLKNGVYTYVVLGFDEGAPQIYMLKTLNLYELGTKHHQLVHRISCDVNEHCKKYKLYYAGEIYKQNKNISFNFYSGTFKMEQKMKKKTLPQDIEYMKQFSPDLQFVDEPLITTENIQLTRQDLDFYKKMGAKIYEFDDQDVCQLFSKKFIVNPRLNDAKYLEKMVIEKGRAYGGSRHKK